VLERSPTWLSVFILGACQGDPVGEAAQDAGGGAGGSAASRAIGGGAGSSGAAGAGAAGADGGASGSGGTASGGQSGGGSGGAATGGSAAGGAGGSSGVTGPGPHGALPSGYCCTSDQECRYRRCRDFGGVKLCSDECRSDAACATGAGMVCSEETDHCEPAGTPSCIPADQWQVGALGIGECCVRTGDGWAGRECAGNLCMAFGDWTNPFVCTHACDLPADCPPKFDCNPWAGFCMPLAELYTCR
jgi:hypothetical protein